MGYMAAKIRGVVVVLAIVGLASIFGWSGATTETIITAAAGIGLVFFIISLFRKRGS